MTDLNMHRSAVTLKPPDKCFANLLFGTNNAQPLKGENSQDQWRCVRYVARQHQQEILQVFKSLLMK